MTASSIILPYFDQPLGSFIIEESANHVYSMLQTAYNRFAQ